MSSCWRGKGPPLSKIDSSALAPALALSFLNVDDDAIGLNAYTLNKPGIVSEPYYGYTETMYIHLNSEPKKTVLLTVSSSLPQEASPSMSLISVSPDDWMVPKLVVIAANDNPVREGDVRLNVTVSTLFTEDLDYGHEGVLRGGHHSLAAWLYERLSAGQLLLTRGWPQRW